MWERAGERVGEGGRVKERAGGRVGEQEKRKKRFNVNDLTLSPLALSLIPRPLTDFISQLWRLQSCEIKSGSGLGTRLPDPIYAL